MDRIYSYYKWLVDDLGDDRLKGWPMMDSPIPTLLVLALYLWSIKVGLPVFMKNRPPYDLKIIIRWYNVFQIITNAILFYGILTSGWLTTLTLGCHLPDYNSNNPESMRLLKWMYLTAMFRVFDLAETAFFILRKKDSQASFLHIYHHCIVYSLLWVAVKYLGGGSASIIMLVNNPVHVIMYSYYLISAEAGPTLRAKMIKWKKSLTIIQMVQFTFLFIHGLQALTPSCPIPVFFLVIYFPNVGLIFYLFYDFYKQAYLKRDAAKHAKANKEILKNRTKHQNERKVA